MVREKLATVLYRAATGSTRTRTMLTLLGPLAFLGFLALLVIASVKVDHLLDLPGLPGHPVDLIISVPLLVSGSLLAGWSAMSFFRNKGTPVPFNPPRELVVEGPCARSRNPMLTGLFMMLFGAGFIMRSFSLVLFFTPSFIGIMVWEIKAVEEPELEKRFGVRYREYRQRVDMFWPGRRR